MQNYEAPKENMGENLDDLGYGDDFLDTTPKIWSMKGKLDLKTSLRKPLLKEWKDKPHMGRKYL